MHFTLTSFKKCDVVDFFHMEKLLACEINK